MVGKREFVREELDPHHFAGHLVASMVHKPRLHTGKQIICWRLISAPCASPCCLLLLPRPLDPPKIHQHFRQTSPPSSLPNLVLEQIEVDPINRKSNLKPLLCSNPSCFNRVRWPPKRPSSLQWRSKLMNHPIKESVRSSKFACLNKKVPLALITFDWKQFKNGTNIILFKGVLAVLALILTELVIDGPSRQSEN